MKTTFAVSDKSYDAEVRALGRTEEEKKQKFELYEVEVHGPDEGSAKGLLKLTPEALTAARDRADEEGGSAEEWLARGCARALAAEVVIRKLTSDFSFVVDHRWIAGASR